ncbi:WG repeat-containing protein [Maribacter sp. 2304DJ31-5]|uniref:WG repeat-containing protein n=1 Tax=Maribacter sp. 2304DJ31-5 TaxID=3386273 RepID=UPI0039BC7EC4
MKKLVIILFVMIALMACKEQKQIDYKYGLQIIKDSNLKGVVDVNGNSILDTKYENIVILDENFIQACSTYSKNRKSCGVFDVNGHEIVPMVTDGILEVYDSKYFLVAMGKSKAIFDLNGTLVLDKQDEIYSYSQGIVVFNNRIVVGDLEVENRYFVRDLNNPKSFLNQQKGFKRYVQLLNPNERKDKFLFKTSNNFIFNTNGKQIKQFANYYNILGYGEGYLTVQNQDLMKGYANSRGELVFKQVFVTAKPFKKGKAKVSIGGNHDFVINSSGICIENCPSERLLKYHGISSWIN